MYSVPENPLLSSWEKWRFSLKIKKYSRIFTHNKSGVDINYHIILRPKYRRKVLVDNVDKKLKENIENVAYTFAKVIGSNKTITFNNVVHKGIPLNWEEDIDIIISGKAGLLKNQNI